MLTVAVDFDGVLNAYQGWAGEDHFAEPMPGVEGFLAYLNQRYRVVILTTRDPEGVRAWLEEHGLSYYVSSVTDRKVGAVAYIDDRAIRFDGDYTEVLDMLGEPTHWEREASE